MKSWKNRSLGREGLLYPLLYVCLVLQALFVLFFVAVTFRMSEQFSFVAFQSVVGIKFVFVLLMMIGGVVFTLMLLIKILDATLIVRMTIQNIHYNKGVFRGRTFGGKEFELDNSLELIENDRFFLKKNIRHFFKENTRHTIIRHEAGDYYLSGNTDCINSLLVQLSKQIAENK